jgi:ParB/RepB/Spo0J family partition protein
MTNAAAVQTIGHEIAAAQFRSIPLAEIEPSPSNPRKTFAGLDELANDFKIRGVLLPLIVRPKGKGFECVAGERRLRAAKLAKLATVPAIVRELSDLEVLEIQIVENAKRQDIHPVEEAEAYRTLRDVHKLSVAEISAKVGRPVGTVYERLKLCELAPEVRKAALAGELPASHAVLIARIPDQKLQAEALGHIVDEDGALPYRDAVELVHRKFMLQLANAPFDTADEKLVAGAGSCAKCPKRTGNQRELFADVKSPDTCTDTACFGKKVAAAAEVRLKVVEAEGKKVLRGAQVEKLFDENYNGEKYLRQNSGFVPLKSGGQYVGNSYMDVAAAVKKNPKIQTVVIAHPDTGKPMELVPVKELPKVKERAFGSHNYEKQERTRKEKERQRRAFAASIVAPLVARAEKGIGKSELIALVKTLLQERRFDGAGDVFARRNGGKEPSYSATGKAIDDTEASLPKKGEAELRGLLFELVVVNKYSAEFIYKGEPSGNLATAAEALGVNIAGARRSFDAAAKAPPVEKKAAAAAEPRVKKVKPAKAKKGKKK